MSEGWNRSFPRRIQPQSVFCYLSISELVWYIIVILPLYSRMVCWPRLHWCVCSHGSDGFVLRSFESSWTLEGTLPCYCTSIWVSGTIAVYMNWLQSKRYCSVIRAEVARECEVAKNQSCSILIEPVKSCLEAMNALALVLFASRGMSFAPSSPRSSSSLSKSIQIYQVTFSLFFFLSFCWIYVSLLSRTKSTGWW